MNSKEDNYIFEDDEVFMTREEYADFLSPFRYFIYDFKPEMLKIELRETDEYGKEVAFDFDIYIMLTKMITNLKSRGGV